mmetsp:Transcript_20277/g.44276  ORF Transcript_20277/g.44276 Transcript_20277/m.44276 type:complete len:426 (-) Transcript_20277:27-1304(-)
MAAPADEVAALATQIRKAKEALKAKGVSSADINRDEVILAKVKKLQQLKQQLDKDDPQRDEAFFARQQAEKNQAKEAEKVLMKSQRELLLKAESSAPKPLIQRKIFHLFQYQGSGPNFRYVDPPGFNADQTGFGTGEVPNPPAYITEKWDGTTMQATSSHIFKRLDLWGGKRKSNDPTGRYDVKLIAWREASGWQGLDFVEADARYKECLEKHLPKFEDLDDGVSIYFEVIHTDINATFKELPGLADIRIFDSSKASSANGDGEFLPFQDTIALAKKLQLPIVGWQFWEQLDVDRMWKTLQAACSAEYDSAAAPLEGYVVREGGAGGRIAKARCEQVQAPGETTPAAEKGSNKSKAAHAKAAKAPAQPQQAQGKLQQSTKNEGGEAESRGIDDARFWTDVPYLAALGLDISTSDPCMLKRRTERC